MSENQCNYIYALCVYQEKENNYLFQWRSLRIVKLKKEEIGKPIPFATLKDGKNIDAVLFREVVTINRVGEDEKKITKDGGAQFPLYILKDRISGEKILTITHWNEPSKSENAKFITIRECPRKRKKTCKEEKVPAMISPEDLIHKKIWKFLRTEGKSEYVNEEEVKKKSHLIAVPKINIDLK